MANLHNIYGERFGVPCPSPRVTAFARVLRHFVPPLQMAREAAERAGKIVPDIWNRLLFRQFWGERILSTDTYFVMDSYEDVRLRNSFRRAAENAGEEHGRIRAESEIIHGTFAPQAAGMLTALFLRHTGRVLRIATDTEVGHKRDATLICYGTSDSNFKTFDIEASSENNLCQFSFDGEGQRAFRVGEQTYSMEKRGSVTYDKAIVLKLSSRENPGHSHVICAGLSEWGSLAAVSYLTKEWKVLHKRFAGFGQTGNFCVLLEVPCGQFADAREIASAVWWQPRASRQSRMAFSGRM